MRTLTWVGVVLSVATLAGGCMLDSDDYDLADDDEGDGGGGASAGPGPSTGGSGPGGSFGAGGEGAEGGEGGAGGSGGTTGAGGENGGAGGEGGGPVDVEVELGPNLNTTIDDGVYNGTLASMNCANLVVPAQGTNIVAGVVVELGIDHSWLGDLTIKLRSPTGTIVTLASLPGVAEAADNGIGESPESSDLDASSPIRFEQGEPQTAESMGGMLGAQDVVCLDDAVCSFTPHPGAAIAGDLDDLVGETASGTWYLCGGDSYDEDVGIIQSVKLTILQ